MNRMNPVANLLVRMLIVAVGTLWLQAAGAASLVALGWSCQAMGQSLTVPPGYRQTSLGVVHESCIHVVPNGSRIDKDQTVTDHDGNFVGKFEPCPYPALSGRLARPGPNGNSTNSASNAPWADIWAASTTPIYLGAAFPDGGPGVPSASGGGILGGNPPDAGEWLSPQPQPASGGGSLPTSTVDAGPLTGNVSWLADVHAYLTSPDELINNFIVPGAPALGNEGFAIAMWMGFEFVNEDNDILQPIVQWSNSVNSNGTPCPSGQECFQVYGEFFFVR